MEDYPRIVKTRTLPPSYVIQLSETEYLSDAKGRLKKFSKKRAKVQFEVLKAQKPKVYRAKQALNTKNGFIRKGDIVPSDYPRFYEAIKGGWVEEVEEPAETKPDPGLATEEGEGIFLNVPNKNGDLIYRDPQNPANFYIKNKHYGLHLDYDGKPVIYKTPKDAQERYAIRNHANLHFEDAPSPGTRNSKRTHYNWSWIIGLIGLLGFAIVVPQYLLKPDIIVDKISQESLSASLNVITRSVIDALDPNKNSVIGINTNGFALRSDFSIFSRLDYVPSLKPKEAYFKLVYYFQDASSKQICRIPIAIESRIKNIPPEFASAEKGSVSADFDFGYSFFEDLYKQVKPTKPFIDRFIETLKIVEYPIFDLEDRYDHYDYWNHPEESNLALQQVTSVCNLTLEDGFICIGLCFIEIQYVINTTLWAKIKTKDQANHDYISRAFLIYAKYRDDEEPS